MNDELIKYLGEVGISNIIDAANMTHTGRLKVAVCGEKKSGKSWLIAKTARKPLYHCDFDDRKESIAGSEDTVIKQYLDVERSLPQAWGQLESDISSLEYAKSKGTLPFKSIALDSMTFLHKIAENQMMKETSNFRKSKIGTMTYMIPQGWDSINYTQVMLFTLLNRVFALDIDVYCVFHTRPEKDRAKSTKEDTVYTDRLTVDPQNLDVLLPKFNDTWRTYVDMDGNFRLQVKADWKFNAATVLHVDKEEEPNIQALLAKHEQRLKEGK